MDARDSKAALAAIDKAVNSKDLFERLITLDEDEKETIRTSRRLASADMSLDCFTGGKLLNIYRRLYP